MPRIQSVLHVLEESPDFASFVHETGSINSWVRQRIFGFPSPQFIFFATGEVLGHAPHLVISCAAFCVLRLSFSFLLLGFPKLVVNFCCLVFCYFVLLLGFVHFCDPQNWSRAHCLGSSRMQPPRPGRLSGLGCGTLESLRVFHLWFVVSCAAFVSSTVL